MNKVYLVNFSLMEKIADKRNGKNTEDATAYITAVELFFTFLSIEFFILRILPFRVSDFILFGIMVIIWYYSHYNLRESIKKKVKDRGIRKIYFELETPVQKKYLLLSVLLFFAIFFAFFAASVFTIGGYDKRW